MEFQGEEGKKEVVEVVWRVKCAKGWPKAVAYPVLFVFT